MKIPWVLVLAVNTSAWAQTPAILLEACNQLEPASKRLECLKAATGVAQRTPSPKPLAALQNSKSLSPSTARAAPTLSSQTCFVGPRGGTYTITASGKKNYGGC